MNARMMVILVAIVLAQTFPSTRSEANPMHNRPPEKMSFLQNETLRIGIDLNLGGAITYVADPRDGNNIINSRDWGRQIQQSYYCGPTPFGGAHGGWKPWCWNPIGTGDVYGNPAKVLKSSNDGKTLYIKSIPMQWALDNVPGECTFETWITLNGPTAHVRCRLTNDRSDKTQYPAHDQELPAVYTIGKLYRLMTYDGNAPFTNAPLRQVEGSSPRWANWKATENWAALVDDQDRGLGVFHEGVVHFLGGFHGKVHDGGPLD